MRAQPPAEGWTPIEYNRATLHHDGALPHSSLRRRRLDAARSRRQRLLGVDLAIALALAAIALAPGLAIVALVAIAVLASCAAVEGFRWIRRRRAARAPTRARASTSSGQAVKGPKPR